MTQADTIARLEAMRTWAPTREDRDALSIAVEVMRRMAERIRHKVQALPVSLEDEAS